MPDSIPIVVVDSATAEEREFVLTLGGFGLQISGATLVTHERVPVPLFNYVEVREVARQRAAAFFEKALDHYFQRALRPTFRLPVPLAAHLEEGLVRFGFRRRKEPHLLLLGPAKPTREAPPTQGVGPATADELDDLVAVLAPAPDQVELRRAVEVAWHHPHPEETLVPLVARKDGRVVAVGLRHSYRGIAGVHAIATQPAARGQGLATALVEYAQHHRPGDTSSWVSVRADDGRLAIRLGPLGFRTARGWAVFELPANAQLTLPDPGPPGPPRWRPPRRGVAP